MRGVRHGSGIYEPDPSPAVAALTSVTPPAASPSRAPIRRDALPPPGFLDGETEKRLVSGIARIDARLDLHGMVERDAHEALVRLVEESAGRGCRILLVVTGKGRLGRGVLRRNLPLWLEAPRLRHHVTGYRVAFARDGGAGAVYILLRRNKQV